MPLRVLQREAALVIAEHVGQVQLVRLGGRGVAREVALVEDVAVGALLHRRGAALQSANQGAAVLLRLNVVK